MLSPDANEGSSSPAYMPSEAAAARQSEPTAICGLGESVCRCLPGVELR